MTAAEILERKADDYRALGEEHAAGAANRLMYWMIELCLRELAAALEAEREAA